jgi:D-alanine-D-alanine ligase
MSKPRIRVAVVYGGRSSEHEVSLESARCVLDHLDAARYEIIPIAVDKAGAWHVQDLPRLRAPGTTKALPVDTSGATVSLATRPTQTVLEGDRAPAVDVVFPVMHGPLCEDGAIQGLFELADVAYVGAGVLGSAVCMDKDVAKRLVRAAGIATPDYLCVRAPEWAAAREACAARVANDLGYPVFVKPANMGSSVGIHRVRSATELSGALDDALRYDVKALVERAVDCREIEVAVLGATDPAAPPDTSVPGEIVPKDAFYSYERKYLDPDGARLLVPAPLTQGEVHAAQDVARRAFLALECDPMARVDLFYERGTGRWLFSEANTIPGFTTISMYPKLWEASGLTYGALLDRLVQLALRRQAAKRALRHER